MARRQQNAPDPEAGADPEAGPDPGGAPRTTGAPDPAGVVVAFFRAFEDDDVDAVVALVDEDIAYTNVSLPTVHGRARFEELTRRVLRPDRLGFRAHLTHVMSDGDVVLTDRVDELRVGRFAMRFWVYGRFVVRDGRISVWRDSFDWFDVTVAALRGLAGLVSPGLNRRMPGD